MAAVVVVAVVADVGALPVTANDLLVAAAVVATAVVSVVAVDSMLVVLVVPVVPVVHEAPVYCCSLVCSVDTDPQVPQGDPTG